MTLPPVVRVFFAISPPPLIREKVKRIISDIKKLTKNHSIRFTLPENLHVTLQFIGEVKVEHLALISKNVQTRLDQEMLKLEFEFGKLAVLPSPYQPRVIVLDIKSQDKMAHLSQVIGNGIVDAGYEIEKRPFHGHLTLGRIKQPKALDLKILHEVVLPELDVMPVTEIAFYRSEPHPEGSHYMVLETLALIK